MPRPGGHAAGKTKAANSESRGPGRPGIESSVKLTAYWHWHASPDPGPGPPLPNSKSRRNSTVGLEAQGRCRGPSVPPRPGAAAGAARAACQCAAGGSVETLRQPPGPAWPAAGVVCRRGVSP